MNSEINLLLNYISFASFWDSVDNFKLKDSKTDNSIVRIPNEIVHLKSYDYFCDLVKNNKVNLKPYNVYKFLYPESKIINYKHLKPNKNSNKFIRLVVSIFCYIEEKLELIEPTHQSLDFIINDLYKDYDTNIHVRNALEECETDAIKLIDWIKNHEC